MRRSVGNLVLPITLKLSIDAGTPHDNACCLILEWGGTVKRDPVRKLLPACSATLVCRVRIVEKTYSDSQRAQLNLYTREDRIANGSCCQVWSCCQSHVAKPCCMPCCQSHVACCQRKLLPKPCCQVWLRCALPNVHSGAQGWRQTNLT